MMYNDNNGNIYTDMTGKTVGERILPYPISACFSEHEDTNVYQSLNTYNYYENIVYKETIGQNHKEGINNMSLAIIFKNNNGIVLLADSRLTIVSNGTKQLKSDNGEKIYYIKDLEICISCVGVQDYDGKSWIDYIKEVESQSKTCEEFILNFRDFLVLYQHIGFQFFVAVPKLMRAYETNTYDPTLRCVQLGTRFQGEIELAKTIINKIGYYNGDSLVEAAKHYSKIMKNVIHLGDFLQKEIGQYNSVGGKINIAIMTYNGKTSFIDESDLFDCVS